METAIGPVVGPRIGEARVREVDGLSGGDRDPIVGVDRGTVYVGIEWIREAADLGSIAADTHVLPLVGKQSNGVRDYGCGRVYRFCGGVRWRHCQIRRAAVVVALNVNGIFRSHR